MILKLTASAPSTDCIRGATTARCSYWASTKGSDTMPKLIDVTLLQIACTASGFGGTVDITGDLIGTTFKNNPNNPDDSVDTRDIFAFPRPITIGQGQVVKTPMKRRDVRNAVGFHGPAGRKPEIPQDRWRT